MWLCVRVRVCVCVLEVLSKLLNGMERIYPCNNSGFPFSHNSINLC